MLYRQNLLLGAVLMIAAEFLFASMGAAVKAAAAELPNEVIVFVRNVLGLLILLPLLARGGLPRLRTQVFHLHLLRAVAGLAAMYCFFYALAHLHLAEGMLLKMTAPIFMPIVAWLWLTERLPAYATLAIPLGFAGVMLVLRPEGDFNWIAVIGVLGGALAAIAQTSLRRLGRSEPTVRVVFYFSLLAALFSALPMVWAWQTPTPALWVSLAVVALTGTLGQLLLTRGYAVAATGRLAPFIYFSVVFGALYGYWLWDERLHLSFVLGATLIAIGGVLAVRARERTTPAEPNAVRSSAE
ncbi:MAG: hypothetical protein AMJ69_04545 [Gammaproteobacteria bacterium SG8_47]|nr:MAG: hypothetical protein AMJ69_04545 [Gammaproteobacteria bacterium SG8_47]